MVHDLHDPQGRLGTRRHCALAMMLSEQDHAMNLLLLGPAACALIMLTWTLHARAVLGLCPGAPTWHCR